MFGCRRKKNESNLETESHENLLRSQLKPNRKRNELENKQRLNPETDKNQHICFISFGNKNRLICFSKTEFEQHNFQDFDMKQFR